MEDDELFFFAQAIQLARKQPISECLKFLRGLLALISEGNQYRNRYRSALARAISQLGAGEAQLELIQIGQLELDLPTDEINE
jgi:hypothetical protein